MSVDVHPAAAMASAAVRERSRNDRADMVHLVSVVHPLRRAASAIGSRPGDIFGRIACRHELPDTRTQRTEDHRDQLRELDHPWRTGRGRHRDGLRARGARRRDHHLRHRRCLRRRPGRGRDGPGPLGHPPRGPGDLHQGVLADRSRPQRPRAVAQAHHGIDRCLAAAPGNRLRRSLPGPPLRSRDAARGDHGRPGRRGSGGQGALHRRLRMDRGRDPRRRRPGPRTAHPVSCRHNRSTRCCGG